jgi:urease accessory protein
MSGIAMNARDEAARGSHDATLRRARTVIRAGQWARSREGGQIVADFQQRHRRRYLYTTTQGQEFLLDLKAPTHLRHNDGLVLEDNTIILVVAQPEDLVEITSFDDRSLTVIAWHLGNRHIPVQILRHSLRIRANPTTQDLLERLGATITPISAAFDPEPGASPHG